MLYREVKARKPSFCALEMNNGCRLKINLSYSCFVRHGV